MVLQNWNASEKGNIFILNVFTDNQAERLKSCERRPEVDRLNGQ